MAPLASRTTLAAALLLTACAERKHEPTEAPASASRGGASSSTAAGQCQPGGPSVDLNIRGRMGGDDMPQEELGTLLGWIGGFAQPCREAPAEVERFTLEIEIGAAGQPPKLVLVERDALPSLAACLDESFAKAPPPPGGPMMVKIVIPWGCSTLGPGYQPETAKTNPAEPPTP